MFSEEQLERISDTERQYHALQHVPPGVDPFEVHSGRIPRVYQPNQDLENQTSRLLMQIRDLLLRQSGTINVLCPSPEIKAAVEKQLNPHELARANITVGV